MTNVAATHIKIILTHNKMCVIDTVNLIDQFKHNIFNFISYIRRTITLHPLKSREINKTLKFGAVKKCQLIVRSYRKLLYHTYLKENVFLFYKKKSPLSECFSITVRR